MFYSLTTFLVGFMVSEIPRVSVFGYCPYSVIFPYLYYYYELITNRLESMVSRIVSNISSFSPSSINGKS